MKIGLFFHPTHVVARGRGARDLRRNKPVRGATERRRVVIRTRIEIVRGVPSGFGRFRVVWENENLIKKKKNVHTKSLRNNNNNNNNIGYHPRVIKRTNDLGEPPTRSPSVTGFARARWIHSTGVPPPGPVTGKSLNIHTRQWLIKL